MGERELMKLRELKEAAHALFARGRYAQCAETYERILRLAPKDPNVRVRHAESCRRAGDRQSAINSYRAAAALLMDLGCESRARGALRAALELDAKNPVVLAELARLEHPSGPISAAEVRAPETPPPAPPPYILRAAEESSGRQALPTVPTVAPLNGRELRTARPTLAPVSMMPPANLNNVVPSITPIIQGQLISPPPVASPRPRPVANTGAVPLTMVPIHRTSAGGEAQQAGASGPMPYRPELRRLGPNAVALRVSPQARWVIIRSDSPLEVSRAETLPALEEAHPHPVRPASNGR